MIGGAKRSSVHACFRPSLCLSVCPPHCPSVCPSVRLSVYQVNTPSTAIASFPHVSIIYKYRHLADILRTALSDMFVRLSSEHSKYRYLTSVYKYRHAADILRTALSDMCHRWLHTTGRTSHAI